MKLLIELDEKYINAINKIEFLVGGRSDRKLQLEIIKAIKNGQPLEQEPTTKNDLGVASKLEKNSQKLAKDFGELDCISRQAVLDLIDADWKYENLEIEINNLPSVTPQEPKTGHWIEVHPLQEDDGGAYMCSKCRCGHPYIAPHWKYCPNCGCRMVELQESEDKE